MISSSSIDQENSQEVNEVAEAAGTSSSSDVADLFDPGVVSRSQKTDPDIAFVYSLSLIHI